MIRLNDLYPAIQGEGVMTGVPMVLVRLQGCAVGCPWCDTKETWVTDAQNRVGTIPEALGTNPRWTDADPADIALAARKAGPAITWALVTGGEPAEQELAPLVAALHQKAFRVALETSGTATGHLGAGFDWVCVSPKMDMPGGTPVLPEVVARAEEIKMVVGKPADLEALDLLLGQTGKSPKRHQVISIQPVSQQPKATELCLKTCMERGWRLSVQIHKYLGER
jgi:7-carboxy-7-deazaguanine synthase